MYLLNLAYILLMMEQTHTCKCHCYAILVTCFYNMVVAYAASSLDNVFNTTLVCTLYIVAKGEECI